MSFCQIREGEGKHGDLTRRVILVSCRLCNVSRVSLFGSEYMHAHSQVGSSTFNALSINRPFSRVFGAQDWQIKDEETRQGGVREEIKQIMSTESLDILLHFLTKR